MALVFSQTTECIGDPLIVSGPYTETWFRNIERIESDVYVELAHHTSVSLFSEGSE